jgi:hypothetical protein
MPARRSRTKVSVPELKDKAEELTKSTIDDKPLEDQQEDSLLTSLKEGINLPTQVPSFEALQQETEDKLTQAQTSPEAQAVLTEERRAGLAYQQSRTLSSKKGQAALFLKPLFNKVLQKLNESSLAQSGVNRWNIQTNLEGFATHFAHSFGHRATDKYIEVLFSFAPISFLGEDYNLSLFDLATDTLIPSDFPGSPVKLGTLKVALFNLDMQGRLPFADAYASYPPFSLDGKPYGLYLTHESYEFIEGKETEGAEKDGAK